MKFLKKSTLGRLLTADGGANDPELAEVRLTAEEFRTICTECQSLIECKKELEQEVENQKLNIQVTMEAQKESYKRSLQQHQEDFRRIRKELECENNRLRIMSTEKQKDLEVQKKLNSNLKRILREKANAKRGLTPKKAHSGYSILFSAQYLYLLENVDFTLFFAIYLLIYSIFTPILSQYFQFGYFFFFLFF